MTLSTAVVLSGFVCGQATTTPPAAQVPVYEPLRARDEQGYVLKPEGAKPGWWNGAVFYQVFVRSFADGSRGALANDGVGDFRGLIERLDYLNDGDPASTTDLGVDAIWLMPIHPSPSYHGYDIEDYTAVHPQYGTMEDFKAFMEACRARGIRVILDLVINHTSWTHPWFREAQDVTSAKRDWYIWSETDPGYRGPWNQQVWHAQREGRRGEQDVGPYFYGLFSRRMPDLNFRNPQVSAAILDVTQFWLKPEIGVHGYRLDAIRHLVEDGVQQDNTPETHAWLERFYATYKAASPDAVAVGEVWASTEIASSYVGARTPGAGQMDLAFEFDLAGAMVRSARTGEAKHVARAQDKVLRHYPPGQYGRFLSNHDQTRVASELQGDPGRLRTAAAMLLLGPGVPFVYYAEELGQPGTKPDPMLRTPMPWVEPGEPGGFSKAKPWAEAFPAPAGTSVASQTGDEGSLLSWYRRLIAVRRAHEALASGGMLQVQASEPGVYAFLRTPERESKGRPVLVLINLSDKAAVDVRLSAERWPLERAMQGRDLLRKDGELVRLSGKDGALKDAQGPSLEAFGVMVVPLESVW